MAGRLKLVQWTTKTFAGVTASGLGFEY